MNFNNFEDDLYGLYQIKSEKNNIPKKIYTKLYHQESEAKKLDLIKLFYNEWEDDKNVTDAILNTIQYFNKCSELRNILVHSQQAPINSYNQTKESILLARKINRKSTKKELIELQLNNIRSIADKIHIGSNHCFKIYCYLQKRDFPDKHYLKDEHVPLPNKLDIPDMSLLIKNHNSLETLLRQPKEYIPI